MGGAVVYEALPVVYAAELVGQPVGTVLYGSPISYASAPMVNQPVYNISPERFQLIMQGQPLTQDEIAALTGSVLETAPPVVEEQPISVVVDSITEPASESIAPDEAADSKKEKKEKKSSKKKVTANKKEKGCC